MTISNNLQELINRQIKQEFDSFYAYLGMAGYFEGRSLHGFAQWMRLQSTEEMGHALKFVDYLHDRNGRADLRAIEPPASEYKSALDVFERSLKQEQEVTASIYEIYELAHQDRDYATVSFLKWFSEEQVEEEKSASDMVDRLKIAGDNPDALLFLDGEAGKRVMDGGNG